MQESVQQIFLSSWAKRSPPNIWAHEIQQAISNDSDNCNELNGVLDHKTVLKR